ncbi:MFS transporter [Kitasatospora sp. MMS16-BH015]|uniref:MFS transporter n=1 Tax=Kitasatospora sp. MMS16-BH015 TaxID=2018025 RepID=UPI000CA1C025|nr:MFS transporter [Kitasatospora sp. MMS16-BH015]AUG76663.1 MFS transporter [Kitasatospora sp. MMS16-BH015]
MSSAGASPRTESRRPGPGSPTGSGRLVGGGALGGALGVPTMVLVTLVTVLSKGPLFLPGAVSDLLQRDLGLGPGGIGLIIALYWTGSTYGAYLSRRGAGGGVVERRIGVALLATATVLVVTAVWPLVGLWAGAVVGGLVYGYTQPHTNFLLVRRCAPRVQGVAFGIKQASIPLAVLFYSLAVPAIAVPAGWRPLFLVAGLLCAAQGGHLLTFTAARGTRSRARQAAERLTLDRQLFALAAAGACGAAVGNSLGGFLFSSLTHDGNSTLTASLLVSGGSVLAAVVRIVVGRRVDRSPTRPLRLLMLLFLLGAAGTALLTVPLLPAQLLGTLLAFGGGWGWAGLLHHTASAAYPGHEAAATAYTQMGVSIGGALGPLGFGLLITATGHTLAWWSMTALALAACLCLTRAGHSRLD